MSVWQAIFAVALLSSLWAGGSGPRLWLAMLGNLAAGAMVSADYASVAIVDLAAASALVFGGARERVVAALFVAMQPIYGLGAFAGWPENTTYAIIDVLAFVQCAIIGGVDNGARRLARHIPRRNLVGRDPAALRPAVAGRCALAQENG